MTSVSESVGLEGQLSGELILQRDGNGCRTGKHEHMLTGQN